MKRLSATVCAGLLATAVLTGCGDDNGGGDSDSASGGDYCGQVEDFKGEFDVLNGEDTTLDELSGAVDRVGGIKDSAPEDVESSWSALHDAMETMIGGMEDLGIEGDQPLQEQMTKLQSEDPEKLQELMKSMSGMQDIQSDADAIEKNVKAECDIELSDGGSDDEGSDSGSDDGGS